MADLMTTLTGFLNGRAVLTDQQVVDLRTTRESEGISFYKLANMFGISQPQAFKICKGQARATAGGPIEGLRFGTIRVSASGRCKGCGAKLVASSCLKCQLVKT